MRSDTPSIADRKFKKNYEWKVYLIAKVDSQFRFNDRRFGSIALSIAIQRMPSDENVSIKFVLLPILMRPFRHYVVGAYVLFWFKIAHINTKKKTKIYINTPEIIN